MTTYAISAQVRTYKRERNAVVWSGSLTVPTFYLNGDVQGIRDEQHAVEIARTIIDPLSVLHLDILADKQEI